MDSCPSTSSAIKVPTSPTVTTSTLPQTPPPTVSLPEAPPYPLPLSLPPVTTELQSKPHILPSLLKHSTSNNPSKPVKGKRGGRPPGRSSKLNTLMNNSNDVVSLEGVVKSPGGTDKKIVVTIPSIEYPVSLML